MDRNCSMQRDIPKSLYALNRIRIGEEHLDALAIGPRGFAQ